LEGGAYLLNYAGCHQCKQKGFVAEKDRVREEDENGDELITFKREPSQAKQMMSYVGCCIG